jgi:hypothetical protein
MEGSTMIGIDGVREPTLEECSSNARVGPGHACWYPQMGGYVARAVVVPNGSVNACFDVAIWHDGEFPFSGDTDPGRQCIWLHHCDPEQFVRFGEWVKTLPGMGETHTEQ